MRTGNFKGQQGGMVLSQKLFFLLIAMISGTAMAIQGSLNAVLGRIIGLLEATVIVHVVGAIISIALLLFGLGQGDLSLYNKAPWYTYLGGLVGVIIIYAVAVSIPKVGVASATTAIIVGQTLTALLIDHFGLFGLEKSPFQFIQLVGIILLAIGGKLILK